MMRLAGNHVEAAILRAIVAEISESQSDGENPVMIVEEIESTDWASATFVGATHQITIRLEGGPKVVNACATGIVNNLPEREIPIAGRIVAELAVDEDEQRNIANNNIAKTLIVNALTIRD